MKRPVENVVPSFSINWLQKLETRAKYSADIKTSAKQHKQRRKQKGDEIAASQYTADKIN